jgi:hypothetical protein
MGKTCSSYEAMQNAGRNLIGYPKQREQLGDFCLSVCLSFFLSFCRAPVAIAPDVLQP